MPALGSIHAIARAVCTFQGLPCQLGVCEPVCLERARRAVRAMREAGALKPADGRSACNIAQIAHAAQIDKGRRPYIEHVMRVWGRTMLLLGGLPSAFPQMHIRFVDEAALLHDVVEDAPWALDDLLLHGFSDETIEMVRLLTKPAGDTRPYAQRIEDLIASGNLGAILIKLADVEDNGDPARLALLPEDQRGIGERYQRARVRLHEAATALGWRDPREQAESAA